MPLSSQVDLLPTEFLLSGTGLKGFVALFQYVGNVGGSVKVSTSCDDGLASFL